MNLPALKRVSIASSTEPATLARQLLQFLQNVSESLSPLLARPRAFTTVQEVELIAATPKIVSHKLQLKTGQTPAGWLITNINANTTVRWNAWDDKTITIQAANTCTVQLEVW